MKVNRNYIKLTLVLGLVFFMLAFAEKRNSRRNLEAVEVSFTNNENLYITKEAVNKLLIQNQVTPQAIGKEALDLNKVEGFLDAHEMIENAEVFLSVDGRLGAAITQRKPIARVLGPEGFYIDRNGLKMPLSEFYSARVPVLTAVRGEDIKKIFPLLDFIRKDEFLSRQIVGIEKAKSGTYIFNIRGQDFIVHFGKVASLERKFNNYKAFYQEALSAKKLNTYKKVDLQFGNQVVCTKK